MSLVKLCAKVTITQLMLAGCQTKHADNWCTYEHQWAVTKIALLVLPYVWVEHQIIS